MTFTPRSRPALTTQRIVLLVCPGHHHDVRGSGFGHQLGLKVAAVHGLQVGHDGDAGEALA